MASVSTISGVGSGIDWQATIDALMNVEKQKVTLLERRQTTQQAKLDAWRNLNTRLLGLRTMMDGLEEADSFLVNTAASSDADRLVASASSTATAGVHGVLVDRLATAARLVHGGVADADATALNSSGGDQVFAYTYGSGGAAVTRTLAVPDGTTLQGLRDLINQDGDNPGVRASLLNDGSGGATAWHLVLSGTDTGAAAQLAVDDALTTLGDGTAFDGGAFTLAQSAQSARFRVDGYPAAGWLESDSNTVDDAIEGLTLTLKDDSAGEEIQVSVTRNDDAVVAKVQAFVAAYNDLVGQINSYTAYNTASETMGVLLGDSSVNQLKRALTQLATRPMEGLAEGSLRTLGEAGIRSGTGGLLTMDAEKLRGALAERPAELTRLFTFNAASSTGALAFFTRTADVPAGEVAVSATYDAAGALVSATLGGATAQVDGDLISAAADSPWAGLRLRFRDPGDGPGTRTGTVTLAHGLAAALTRSLGLITNDQQGLVHFQTDHLEATIADLNDSIERMNARLTAKREQLTREFLAMETTLSRLRSQSSALGSLTSSGS